MCGLVSYSLDAVHAVYMFNFGVHVMKINRIVLGLHLEVSAEELHISTLILAV